MRFKLLTVGLLAALCASSAMAAKDKFNRGQLGSNWVVTSGSMFLVGHVLTGTSLSLGYFTKSTKSTSVSADVLMGGACDLQYGAVALGDIAGGKNAFVKIQTQDGGCKFDHAAFYVGNNGGGSFFALDTPIFGPVTLSVTMSGTVATMTIQKKGTEDTQSYSYDYGTSFGTGGGLGTYGTLYLDNYASSAPAEELTSKPVRITGSNAKDLSLNQ